MGCLPSRHKPTTLHKPKKINENEIAPRFGDYRPQPLAIRTLADVTDVLHHCLSVVADRPPRAVIPSALISALTALCDVCQVTTSAGSAMTETLPAAPTAEPTSPRRSQMLTVSLADDFDEPEDAVAPPIASQ